MSADTRKTPAGPVAYYGHHKCASSWINRILWNVTAELGLRFESYSSDDRFGGDLPAAVEAGRWDVLSLRNARWDYVEAVPPQLGIHVIRDPRDIVVSAYFSHLKTHLLLTEELREARERLQKLPKEEGLVAEMDGMSGRYLKDMAAWRYGANPRIHEYKMEDLTPNWEVLFPRIMEDFGWLAPSGEEPDDPLGARMWSLVNQVYRRSGGWSLLHRRRERLSLGALMRILHRLSFNRLSGGRKPGQTDESSHYRKGKAGDWENHFTPEVKAAFKERFPGMVTQLGYAENEDW